MSRIVSRTVTDYTSKTDAFPYQLQAFLTVRDLDYSAILHEQGLGKTKIAVDLMLYRYCDGRYKKAACEKLGERTGCAHPYQAQGA